MNYILVQEKKLGKVKISTKFLVKIFLNSLSFISIILLFTCSSSDDSNSKSMFSVNITQDVNTINIGQITILTATTSESINSINFSLDGGATFNGEYSTNFGNTAKLYLDFDTIGTKNIVFRVKNSDGDIVDSPVTINVERGNAIQLKSLKLNSFFDMGKTWDAEYSDTNINRLADVFFVFLKPPLNVFTGTRSGIPTSSWLWYKSEIKMNESNLIWDLQNEDLYINIEELRPYIAFADDDGGGLVGDLMLGPPFERVIPFSDYIITKPPSILIEETNINLEYELDIDW